MAAAFFGVPLANFLGWTFTVYLFMQVFALYLRAATCGDDYLPGLPPDGQPPCRAVEPLPSSVPGPGRSRHHALREPDSLGSAHRMVPRGSGGRLGRVGGSVVCGCAERRGRLGQPVVMGGADPDDSGERDPADKRCHPHPDRRPSALRRC
jgi:hypothetical protein